MLSRSAFCLAILLLISVANFFSFTSSIDAAYVRLNSSTPICFIEETSYSKEQIVFQYEKLRSSQNQLDSFELNTVLTSADPLSGKPYFTKELTKKSGIFVIPTVVTSIGAYEICVSLPHLKFLETFFGGHSKPLPSIDIEVLIDHEHRRVPIQSAKEHHVSIRTKVSKDSLGGRSSLGAPVDYEVFSYTDANNNLVSALRSHDYLDRVETNLEKISKLVDEVELEAKALAERHFRMRQTSESTFSRVWGFAVLIMVSLGGMTAVQLFSLRKFFKDRKIA